MPTAVLDVPGLRTRSRRWLMLFVRKMKAIGADPSMVAGVISRETAGTFDPQKTNPDGAVGLIQWTTIGAATHGLTRDEIARMSDERQLDLVRDWYARRADLSTFRPIDYYLAVFAPSAIGKPDGAEVYSLANTPAQFAPNARLDIDGDDVITVGEVRSFFEPVIATAKKKPPLIVVDESWPYLVIGLGMTAAASAGAYAILRRRRAA